MDKKQKGFSTQAVHGGEEQVRSWGTTNAPLFQSAAFSFPDLETWQKAARGETSDPIYSRNSNPTLEILERKLSLLEGGEACAVFSSGMAAITAIVLSLLKPGARLLSARDIYGGTYLLFSELLPRWGVDVRLLPSEEEALMEAMDSETGVVFIETPSNPTLKILDIRRIAAHASKAGAILVVDSTMATPFNQQPLGLGCDLVVHSATKYLSGHGDVLAGAVISSRDFIKQLLRTRELTGGCLDAHAAWLLIRGLKTLSVRMTRHNQTALAVARFLDNHPKVIRVLYPGLQNHAHHGVAESQMKGFGGVVSFEVRGGLESTRRMVEALNVGYRAANLGSVETVFGPPAFTSHVECTEEERRELGISESLIRYAVGLEDEDDLISDLERALREVGE
jgi:cystathionine gamma-synthase